MGGPMGQPQGGPPPAAAAGPPGRLSSSNHLIGRILNLINPPQPPQQPPQAPQGGPPPGGMMPGGMGMPPMQGGGMAAPPGGGDPRAQIMQLLAMAQQGGGQPPARAAMGGPQEMWGQGGGDRVAMIRDLLGGGGMPMRRGGYPLDYMPGIPGLPVRTPYAKGGNDYVRPDGRGDGRSDHVPAVLSPGEFVMDAETVALAGNGDNEAGARRLEGMRQNLRKQKGAALAKGKFSPDTKPLESYLPKGTPPKKRGRS